MLKPALEQELQTEADPQEGSSRVDEVANRLGQVAASNLRHRIAEGADAGQDQFLGRAISRGSDVMDAWPPTRSIPFWTLRRLPIW